MSNTVDLKIPSSVTNIEDRYILCRLERLYGHVNDTHTGDLNLVGITAIT